jgi:hypothetical protein
MSQTGIVLHVDREEVTVKVPDKMHRGGGLWYIRYFLGPIALDWFTEEMWGCESSRVLCFGI